MEKIRVLIASDYRSTRTGLRKMLGSVPDFDVIGEAESVPQVGDAYREFSPDIVLLEVSAPGPLGLRATAQLLQDFPTARLVLLTTNENLSYVRSIMASGALGYVLKRATEAEMYLALKTAFRGRRYLDPRLSDSLYEVLLGKSLSPTESPYPKLSRRELEVLGAIAQGFTRQEIARSLKLSVKTVETYRARIYEKLGFKSRSDLVHYALALGLMDGAGSGA